MSSIDERVVAMRFDNGQFERGIKMTMSSLKSLKKGLNLDESKKSLGSLGDAAKKFSLSHIADSLDNISSKFSVFGAIGFAAIQRLTNAAMDFGKTMVSSVLDPLVEGGKKR